MGLAYAAKALKEMHERKEIEGRAAGCFPFHIDTRRTVTHGISTGLGKQLVYHVLQDPADDLMPDALHTMDQEIQQLQNDLTVYKSREKELRAELLGLSAKVSIAELRQDVCVLEKEKGSCLMRLLKIQTEALKPIGMEEKIRVETSWKTWQRHRNTRRRICRDLWSRCTEVLPEDTTEDCLWVCRSIIDTLTICHRDHLTEDRSHWGWKEPMKSFEKEERPHANFSRKAGVENMPVMNVDAAGTTQRPRGHSNGRQRSGNTQYTVRIIPQGQGSMDGTRAEGF